MNITPIGTRVVVLMDPDETQSAGGITLPNGEKQTRGTVIAVGPGKATDAGRTEMQVKVGDRIVVGPYAGTEIKIADRKVTVVDESELLCVLET